MTVQPTLAAMLEWLDREAMFESNAGHGGERTEAYYIIKAIRARLAEQDANTLPEIPKGWHVSWMGRDKSDGMFIAQLKISDPDAQAYKGIHFVSRTGITWQEAMTASITKINQTEG